ncbi:hypothetical protein GUJ93_ZPchr0007g4616 [Zizania palustris]|uniref:Uncharacterized protein n=1 Tax=Zizania palustris TaxID=103762 RepID=A0A8J5TJR2_ZIZPA|nr:hypothetical protein GUJ93_ZPchr0007g4616 [Zizania palustris]
MMRPQGREKENKNKRKIQREDNFQNPDPRATGKEGRPRGQDDSAAGRRAAAESRAKRTAPAAAMPPQPRRTAHLPLAAVCASSPWPQPLASTIDARRRLRRLSVRTHHNSALTQPCCLRRPSPSPDPPSPPELPTRHSRAAGAPPSVVASAEIPLTTTSASAGVPAVDNRCRLPGLLPTIVATDLNFCRLPLSPPELPSTADAGYIKVWKQTP